MCLQHSMLVLMECSGEVVIEYRLDNIFQYFDWVFPVFSIHCTRRWSYHATKFKESIHSVENRFCWFHSEDYDLKDFHWKSVIMMCWFSMKCLLLFHSRNFTFSLTRRFLRTTEDLKKTNLILQYSRLKSSWKMI